MGSCEDFLIVGKLLQHKILESRPFWRAGNATKLLESLHFVDNPVDYGFKKDPSQHFLWHPALRDYFKVDVLFYIFSVEPGASIYFPKNRRDLKCQKGQVNLQVDKKKYLKLFCLILRY